MISSRIRWGVATLPARKTDCKVSKNRNLTFASLAVAALLASSPASAAGQKGYAKLDGELNERATTAQGSATTSIILRVKGAVPAEFKKYARPASLDIADTYVLDVPNSLLKAIAAHANTLYASHNGTVRAFNFRTGIQSGAFFVRNMLGINGAGIGVALLDSGVAPNSETPVTFFKDFLVPDKAHPLDTQCALPCDPNGHGTHVAGTIAGNGVNSGGEKSGMAPGASLIALRVLGADGTGSIDGVLKALEWIRKHAKEQNIRVVNLSFGAKPTSRRIDDPDPMATLLQDPLARATKSLVDAGIFVVAAAGNVGQVECSTLPKIATPDADGKCNVFGGITAPGNFPWVFTVGANSSNGSLTRGDDSRATFSSRGPALPLQIAKPDLLAGGVGIESTTAPGSTLYNSARPSAAHPGGFLIPGAFPTAGFPYMTLSGTSQAAAVVSGVAAQMLQVNPKLTPNLIKAILEYTAQDYNNAQHAYSPLEQGAGFLNALGAVRLSRFYATAKKGTTVPVESIWSKHIIWGNHDMSGGFMLPKANAWNVGTDWGAAMTADGDNIVWGTSCGSPDCGDNIVWGTASDGDNIVWGTSGAGDNIVWGTAADGDNIVWGTDCSLSGADCGNHVWGTTGAGDNIVWGTASTGDNIVWGTSSDGDNIVWGTASAGDNIVWGTDIQTGQLIITPLPSTQFDWYTLFLGRQFDALWVSHEFFDTLVSLDGHRKLKPTRSRAHK